MSQTNSARVTEKRQRGFEESEQKRLLTLVELRASGVNKMAAACV